jgi:hypothetical protein
LFVNPGSDVAENLEITVFDQGGRKIQSFKSYYDGVSPIMVDVSTISGGFYFLSVQKSIGSSIKSFAIIR